MLDDDAYLHWLDQCGFSDPARTLLTDIRRSPPVRRTTGGWGNIHGQYPSRKMRRTIQFESYTELGAIYLIEHGPAVLEFWDQPTKLSCTIVIPPVAGLPTGIPRTFWCCDREGPVSRNGNWRRNWHVW